MTEAVVHLSGDNPRENPDERVRNFTKRWVDGFDVYTLEQGDSCRRQKCCDREEGDKSA